MRKFMQLSRHPTLITLFIEYARHRKGVAAVEFAIIFPIMIILYMGIVEFSQGFTVDRRISKIAGTTADLVAQSTTVTGKDLEDIYKISEMLLAPFDIKKFALTFSSIVTDANGRTTVGWSCKYTSKGAQQGYATGSKFTVLPTGLSQPSSSIIMTRTEFGYKSLVSYHIAGEIKLAESFYTRPRQSIIVTKTGPSGC